MAVVTTPATAPAAARVVVPSVAGRVASIPGALVALATGGMTTKPTKSAVLAAVAAVKMMIKVARIPSIARLALLRLRLRRRDARLRLRS